MSQDKSPLFPRSSEESAEEREKLQQKTKSNLETEENRFAIDPVPPFKIESSPHPIDMPPPPVYGPPPMPINQRPVVYEQPPVPLNHPPVVYGPPPMPLLPLAYKFRLIIGLIFVLAIIGAIIFLVVRLVMGH